jgi:hypothetical protein
MPIYKRISNCYIAEDTVLYISTGHRHSLKPVYKKLVNNLRNIETFRQFLVTYI